MRSRHLSSIFATILAATAAVSTQHACGGAVDGDDPKTDSPTDPTKSTPTTPSVPYGAPFSCTTDELALEALRAAVGADYIERRSSTPGVPDAGGGSFATESSAGTACKTATDANACAAALANATSNDALFARGQDARNRYLVVTKGDDVELIATREAMLAWLGSIDHAAKAWLVALAQNYHPLCDGDWIASVDGAWILRTRLELEDCPIRYAEVTLKVTADGTVSELDRKELEPTGACAGRRPSGLEPAGPAQGRNAVGAFFAHVAHLEAASVHAFRILRDELTRHEAPAALISAATRAMHDEIRHAAAMSRLARRYGAEMPAVVIEAHAPRSLEEMAVENAREGCVRELYGALEASWQARSAADDEVVRVMRGIARDETRHAELSLTVADWLDTKLDDAARERVRRVRIHAFRELEAELRAPRSTELVAVAGVPSSTDAVTLLRELEDLSAAA